MAAALLLACAAGAACGRPVARQTLAIAAAADLRFALDAVAAEFRKEHPGVEPQIAYGSSGNFYSQIGNGAPFDVFLSADVEYPRKLVADGAGEGGSLFVYGVGRIVLWAPKDSPVDVQGLQMRALESDAVQHIAIANPQHAPYGRAAEAALRSSGVYEKVAGKLVMGENIAQTLEFVQSGSAEAGIVALSLALAPAVRDRGTYWEVPLSAYPRVEQGGVILKRAHASQAARNFRAFLLSAAGARILRQYGFYRPDQ